MSEAHDVEDVGATRERGFDDDAIRALVARLSRPHRSGGRVIERATLFAEGTDFAAAIAWIEAHGGKPEAPATAPAGRGLHSARLDASKTEATPARFILPAGALG